MRFGGCVVMMLVCELFFFSFLELLVCDGNLLSY